MANITTYLKNELVEHSLGKSSYTMPTTTYAALFTVAPTIAYTSTSRDGTEVSPSTSSGYERKPITWAAAVDGVISNSAPITWNATGQWNSTTVTPVTTIGIFDAALSGGSPAGSLLWFGPLSASVNLTNGDSFTIPTGLLTVTIA